MTSAAPPPKIKAFLGQVKDQVLDLEGAHDVVSMEAIGALVVQLELAHRGVLLNDNGTLQVSKDGFDSKYADKIWSAARATAGKMLLDEQSKMPKPLLAGLSAITGRVSELCAEIHLKSDSSGNEFEKTASYKEAVERCKEVQDKRLLTLLHSCLLNPNETENYPRLVSSYYLTIAQGCFLRAASFQPDVPPMWKRSWDVVVARRQQSADESDPFGQLQPLEAAQPLSNLIRIAQAKNNKSRVAELQLKLAESYLDEHASEDSADTQVQEIKTTWVAPYQPKTVNDKENLAQLSNSALQACSVADLPNQDAEKFSKSILQARAALAQEDAEIELGSQQLHTSNKNRSATASIQKCRTLAQAQVLAMDKNDSMLEKRTALRDATLSRVFQSEIPESASSVGLASFVLQKLISRELSRLKYVALDPKSIPKVNSSPGWIALTKFIAPILASFQKHSQWDATASTLERQKLLSGWTKSRALFEQNLLRECAVLLPLALWMASNHQDEWNGIDSTALFVFVHDSLSVFLTQTDQKRKAEQASSAIQEGDAHLDTEIQRLRCASTTMKCIVAASNVSEANQAGIMAGIRSVSNDVTAMYRKQADRYASQQKMFGMAVFQCLVAWSGMHRPAWSYCNISEIRRILGHARSAISNAASEWGRNNSPMEDLLMNIAHADSEGGLVGGGFASEAEKRYNLAVEKISTLASEGTIDETKASLFRAHCYAGLARVSQLNVTIANRPAPESIARKSLDEIEAISAESETESAIHIWTSLGSFSLFFRSQLSVSRQLVASTLLSSGKLNDAHSFLSAAVRDSPIDAEASFALGAFFLRMTMYIDKSSSQEEKKAAQVQLLKSAKLDASKANPFALIGVWFEEQNDTKRAIGCYSKALQFNPSHPVAGRGILRLQSFSATQKIVEAASNTNSPSNGWAWRAIGLQKSMSEGQEDLAVVALSKALRCRDIDLPGNEPLSLFFSTPSVPTYPEKEKVEALADLAMCYRRLGRYTASIRTFQAARDTAGDHISSSVLCSCAQVELELGLFDDAVGNFEVVLSRKEDDMASVAAYGHGQALLSLSRRDSQDGKAGASFSRLQQAVQGCSAIAEAHDCAQKLIGDLYSFAVYLPPVVFVDGNGDDASLESNLQAKIQFISRGEKAYQAAIDAKKSCDDDDESKASLSGLICDLGSNILSQAYIIASHKSAIGMAGEPDSEIDEAYRRAEETFRRAIEIFPYFSPAWCGLGCAVVARDALFAQHAFCRSLQLDAMLPDAYANLGFLYSSRSSSFGACEDVMDALTQLADSPAMWMNRAIILERNASDAVTSESDFTQAQKNISRAADAYRAALQVNGDPNAMLGLSLTCRVQNHNNKTDVMLANELRRTESHANLTQYLELTGSFNSAAKVLEGVMSAEKGATTEANWGDDLVQEGKSSIESGIQEIGSSEAIDKQSAHGCLDASNDSSYDKSPDDGSFSISLARRVALDPSNPGLWLHLAQQHIRSNVGIEPAMLAAEKAMSILHHRWLNGTAADSVNALLMSKASSLLFWLQLVAEEDKHEESKTEANPDSGTMGSESEHLDSMLSHVNLQRALMMNPCDSVARAALQLIK